MKRWHKWKNENWFPYTVAACSAVVLFFIFANIAHIVDFIEHVWKLVLPLVFGIVFAYVMDPLARAFERGLNKKRNTHAEIKRAISVFAAAFVVLLVIALIVIAVIPPLFDSIVGLVEMIGDSWGDWELNINSVYKSIWGKDISFKTINEMVSSVIANITSGDNPKINEFLENSYAFGSGFVSGVLGFVLAIYFMLDKIRVQKVFKRALRHILREEKYVKTTQFFYKCDTIILRYLVCDLAEALIVGVSNAIFMTICGLPYIVLISVIVGITNLAPTFGPLFGAVIGSALLLLINPWYALWFLIFTAVIQTIDGYILKPKFFGDTLGVSPLLILITIIMGGRLFGAMGIVLSIPFAAIVQCFIKDFVVMSDKKDSE